MHAAERSYRKVVEHLLISGADPSVQANNRQTALAIAEQTAQLNPTSQDQAEVVRLLKNSSSKR